MARIRADFLACLAGGATSQVRSVLQVITEAGGHLRQMVQMHGIGTCSQVKGVLPGSLIRTSDMGSLFAAFKIPIKSSGLGREILVVGEVPKALAEGCSTEDGIQF